MAALQGSVCAGGDTTREERREMNGEAGERQRPQLLPLIFVVSISLLLGSGFAADPANSKDGTKSDSHPHSGTSLGVLVLYICLGISAVILLAIFLLKLWQKKKREEQHARLLKLFEEDDELEVELGLRD